MTSSSFESVPALPILHSRDLVHWTIINHAIRRLGPDFDVPQHGNGVWAPSIREHNGDFYIFYGDPDRGIFMVKTRDVRGKWDAPVLVKAAKGWIDPCPLWDDDGNAYLVHAFANSRAGIKSILHVNRMSPDGTRLLDEGTLVFDGHANHPTIEGPKFYKRGGWYYIFAPAGGVSAGWQTVLRSRSVLGPYEDRIVMKQGETPINGPHQGAWVHLANGEDWFLHFQDRGAFGRVVHLQPMKWGTDDWPVIGVDADSAGAGRPVLSYRMPSVKVKPFAAEPQASDEFAIARMGLQWQWQANDRTSWSSLSARKGWLRLFATPLSSSREGAAATEGPARLSSSKERVAATEGPDLAVAQNSSPKSRSFTSLEDDSGLSSSRERVATEGPAFGVTQNSSPKSRSFAPLKDDSGLSSSRERAAATEGPALAVAQNISPKSRSFASLEDGSVAATEGPALAVTENLWSTPNVLLQKVSDSVFTASTRVDARSIGAGAAGLVMLGADYSYIGIARQGTGWMIVRRTVTDAPGRAVQQSDSTSISKSSVDLRVRSSQGTCTFEYSVDGRQWIDIGPVFTMKAGRWVGAKVGLFVTGSSGQADFDFLRFHHGELH